MLRVLFVGLYNINGLFILFADKKLDYNSHELHEYFTILYDVICYASRRLLPWFMNLSFEYAADLKCENTVS